MGITSGDPCAPPLRHHERLSRVVIHARPGLPRRYAPRNDVTTGRHITAPRNGVKDAAPDTRLNPSPRHHERRSRVVIHAHSGLPRRCAPRNDVIGASPSTRINEPPLRHHERHSRVVIHTHPGLPRRCAPRNDVTTGRHITAPRNGVKDAAPDTRLNPSPRHHERRSRVVIQAHSGLPRRCAPRNDVTMAPHITAPRNDGVSTRLAMTFKEHR